ncbi:MAG: aminotransferase class III-fold pyridoxal phosphate-dependent enzyme [Roseibium sp.]|uniref:aminotransferase class III-fold pyridoxal phosphate-dependent enzyme n=1 Tax=Roseibium sp. TaxID=1936156 RepID=UPI002626093E|nr:aminotransferase class III-fold pyridoxal phosphate-dependent enzyme [Roseibium sp.]MCV0424191.1 aminotransferase class III-fold pyridoxal phosphate-dependent enzyme [Roseibium sp.]
MTGLRREFQTYKTWDKDNNFHPWDAFDKAGDDKPDRTFSEYAEGIYVFDELGNKVIDGPGGMWCMQLGYGNGEIADAMAAQVRKMAYCSPFSEATSVSAQFAHEIARRAPGDLNRVHFTTGGSTAVDSAIRFIHFRNNLLGKPTKKKIISRVAAYHGGTYLTASLSGKPSEKAWLDTDKYLCHFLPDVTPYRRPEHQSMEDFLKEKVADLENAILDLGPDNVAVFVAEPVLGSGGVIVPPAGYHRLCLEICRKYDVLYLSDEVVTGFGRLGHWFASEEVFGIVPDIITCAKGMTSGFAPMGAAIFSDRLFKDLEGEVSQGAYFTSGFTYSGHPVCAAAGLKNIEIFERDGVLEHTRRVIPHFQKRLAEMLDLPIIADVRGMGLMGAIECSLTRDGKSSPDIDATIGAVIDARCQDLGLMVRPYGNMAIFSPPLIITEAQIDDLFDLLTQGVKEATEELLRQGLELEPVQG